MSMIFIRSKEQRVHFKTGVKILALTHPSPYFRGLPGAHLVELLLHGLVAGQVMGLILKVTLH